MRQNIKILLADDDPALRRLLPLQIAAKDFEILTVESAKEVLELLREEDFEVILLDVNLPDASGVEILSSIQVKKRMPIWFRRCSRRFRILLRIRSNKAKKRRLTRCK